MKTKSASEANGHFSQLLREASGGEVIVITSRGWAVTTLGPSRESAGQRAVARRALLARISAAEPGGPRDWVRDELYDDPT